MDQDPRVSVGLNFSDRGTAIDNSQWIITGDKLWDYTNIGIATKQHQAFRIIENGYANRVTIFFREYLHMIDVIKKYCIHKIALKI